MRWLWNNQYEAIARGNPFPGVSRNTLRGDSFNNVDVSVVKNVRLTERVSMVLQMSAFNALNRGYYGTPDPNIEDSLFPAFYGIQSGFLNNYYAGGGGASPAAGWRSARGRAIAACNLVARLSSDGVPDRGRAEPETYLISLSRRFIVAASDNSIFSF